MLVRFSERVTGVSGFVVSFRVLVFRKFGFGLLRFNFRIVRIADFKLWATWL